MLQLVRRQRIAQLGIGLLPPERCVGLDHRPPLGIERLVGLPAGDDEAMDCSVALTLEPLLRPSLRPWPYRSPKVGRLRQRGERFLIEHHIAEQDVLEVVFEIGRELGNADDEIRSEERRGGKERVSKCRSRWTPYH